MQGVNTSEGSLAHIAFLSYVGVNVIFKHADFRTRNIIILFWPVTATSALNGLKIAEYYQALLSLLCFLIHRDWLRWHLE